MFLFFAASLAWAEPPALEVGPVPGVTALGAPELGRCFDVPPPAPATPDLVGQLVFEVRVRKGKVAAVSTVRADPAVQPLAPCFERELAAWTWGTRKADLQVPISVGAPPAVAPPAPAPIPAAPAVE